MNVHKYSSMHEVLMTKKWDNERQQSIFPQNTFLQCELVQLFIIEG